MGSSNSIASPGDTWAPTPGERFPLTDAQAEKWLGSHYNTQAGLAFSESFELALGRGIDLPLLVESCRTVMNRHEAFSIRIAADGSAQVFDPVISPALESMDFSAQPDPQAAYAQYCAAQSAKALDPARGELVRMAFCRLSADDARVFMQAHHLIIDGWSMRVFLKEWAACYQALQSGVEARLPTADSWLTYSVRERQRREGEEGRAALRYWLDKYRQRPEPLPLPTDRPRSARMSFVADNFCLDIAPDLWGRIKLLSREHKVTRFSVLLSAYVLLLHRLTGQDDLVVGIPFAGAAQGAGARMIGDTDNTLPLRFAPDPAAPVAQFLRQTQTALQEAALHQDVSLGSIVNALQLPRSTARLLLVDSILSLAPAMDILKFGGVTCRLNVMPRLASAWELALHWRQTPGSLVLEVQYHSDLYLASTVRAWARAYVDLLESIASDPKKTPDQLRVNVAVDDFLLKQGGNLAQLETSFPQLLEASFQRCASRVAAECAGQTMDYAQLDTASAAIAMALIRRGIGKGCRVGICMLRSLDMLVAVLGVMRAGAAYVPIDPAFPEDRQGFMAKDAELRHLLTSGQALPEVVAEGREVLVVADLMGDSGQGVLPMVHPDDPAYYLYTSGSTGLPKGVCIVHRNLVNFLQAMQVRPGFSERDVICSATTLSFDIVALELFLPLLCGGKVVIADDDEHRDPAALCRLIESTGCTVLQTTPSLVTLLHEVGRAEVLKPLRMFVGGEALSLPLARTLQAGCSELWNMYGPTETTVWSTVERIQADTVAVSLGAPIANTRIYLLDGQQRPVLAGTFGEIWIGGAGVAEGYLGRPQLTAERFVSDPFANDGSRMYRTGDLGRIQQGKLFFHGRADAQIKLRGYRIEPGEIEAAAASEPGVVECVAVAREAANGDQILVLYLATEAEPGELEARVRARLAQTLPGYMRPQQLVMLASLPKTPNGKIDRKALPLPAYDAEAVVAPVAPRDALERELLKQWQRLLQRESVAVNDNFFEIGGYSLLAVRMFAELHERYGVDLPLATLIERPTISELAQVLRTRTDIATAQPGISMAEPDEARSQVLVELKAGTTKAPLFLMHAVGGNVLNYLPLANRLAPDQPVYGLQSVGLDGRATPLGSIAEMADRYVAEIRKVRPRGPYLLAGGSMGGVLALEVARRLLGAGQRIALLAMFDTYGPGNELSVSHGYWCYPWRWWPLYRQMHEAQKAELWTRIRFRALLLPWSRLRQWLGGGPLPSEMRIRQIERSNLAALANYRHAVYAGGFTLFRTGYIDAEQDLTHGWGGWTEQEIVVVESAGRHDNFVDQPELAVSLQANIDACLDDQGR